MNIFLITSVPLNPPWDQGDKTLAYALTQAMGEHRFHVFAMRHGLLPEGENLHLLPLYSSRNPSIVQKAQVYWHLLGVLRSNGKPDLYHLFYQPTAMSSRLNRLLPEFKYRPTLHTVPSVSSTDKLSPDLFFADQLVTISRHARNVFKCRGFDNVTYIPPGIDVQPWERLRSQRTALKSRLGLSDQPVLLYPGHYAPGYGIDAILRALPRIAAQVPGVQILCACRLRSHRDRKREQTFRSKILELGLEQNFRFFKTVNNMGALIGASDLTVLPLETMQDKVDIPITLLESLAAGVPVIISDLAPMNELLHSSTKDDELAGLAFPPGDAEALAQTAVALLKDDRLRNCFADNGQTLVRKQYDIRQTACQYDQIYRRMAL